MAHSLIRNLPIGLRAGGHPVEHFDQRVITKLPQRAGQVSADWDEEGSSASSDGVGYGLEGDLRASHAKADQGYEIITSVLDGRSRQLKFPTS